MLLQKQKFNFGKVILNTQKIIGTVIIGFMSFSIGHVSLAAVYDGPGVAGGVPDGGGDITLRAFLENVLFVALSYVGLLAVIMIVVSGIMFIFSGGNDELREKAKKIIIYTIIGLIVILLATAIVWFVINLMDPAVADPTL